MKKIGVPIRVAVGVGVTCVAIPIARKIISISRGGTRPHQQQHDNDIDNDNDVLTRGVELSDVQNLQQQTQTAPSSFEPHVVVDADTTGGDAVETTAAARAAEVQQSTEIEDCETADNSNEGEEAGTGAGSVSLASGSIEVVVDKADATVVRDTPNDDDVVEDSANRGVETTDGADTDENVEEEQVTPSEQEETNGLEGDIAKEDVAVSGTGTGQKEEGCVRDATQKEDEAKEMTIDHDKSGVHDEGDEKEEGDHDVMPGENHDAAVASDVAVSSGETETTKEENEGNNLTGVNEADIENLTSEGNSNQNIMNSTTESANEPILIKQENSSMVTDTATSTTTAKAEEAVLTDGHHRTDTSDNRTSYPSVGGVHCHSDIDTDGPERTDSTVRTTMEVEGEVEPCTSVDNATGDLNSTQDAQDTHSVEVGTAVPSVECTSEDVVIVDVESEQQQQQLTNDNDDVNTTEDSSSNNIIPLTHVGSDGLSTVAREEEMAVTEDGDNEEEDETDGNGVHNEELNNIGIVASSSSTNTSTTSRTIEIELDDISASPESSVTRMNNDDDNNNKEKNIDMQYTLTATPSDVTNEEFTATMTTVHAIEKKDSEIGNENDMSVDTTASKTEDVLKQDNAETGVGQVHTDVGVDADTDANTNADVDVKEKESLGVEESDNSNCVAMDGVTSTKVNVEITDAKTQETCTFDDVNVDEVMPKRAVVDNAEGLETTTQEVAEEKNGDKEEICAKTDEVKAEDQSPNVEHESASDQVAKEAVFVEDETETEIPMAVVTEKKDGNKNESSTETNKVEVEDMTMDTKQTSVNNEVGKHTVFPKDNMKTETVDEHDRASALLTSTAESCVVESQEDLSHESVEDESGKDVVVAVGDTDTEELKEDDDVSSAPLTFKAEICVKDDTKSDANAADKANEEGSNQDASYGGNNDDIVQDNEKTSAAKGGNPDTSSEAKTDAVAKDDDTSIKVNANDVKAPYSAELRDVLSGIVDDINDVKDSNAVVANGEDIQNE